MSLVGNPRRPRIASSSALLTLELCLSAACRLVQVQIRELSGIAEMELASTMWDTVWGRREPNHEVDPSLMVALSHAGGYLVAAYDDDDQMVAAALGFWDVPGARSLHSHLTGVLPDYAGQGIGAAIKQHQRDWVLARGGRAITWTFDPLVSRNAHFNLNRLGARPVSYLPDLYGELTDEINAGDPTDRMLVRWDLTPEPAREAAASLPELPLLTAVSGLPRFDPAAVDPDSLAAKLSEIVTPVTVAVPDDIESLRRTNRAAASDWRVAVRSVLLPLLEQDWRITGFRRGVGYLVEPPAGHELQLEGKQ